MACTWKIFRLIFIIIETWTAIYLLSHSYKCRISEGNIPNIAHTHQQCSNHKLAWEKKTNRNGEQKKICCLEQLSKTQFKYLLRCWTKPKFCITFRHCLSLFKSHDLERAQHKPTPFFRVPLFLGVLFFCDSIFYSRLFLFLSPFFIQLLFVPQQPSVECSTRLYATMNCMFVFVCFFGAL